MKQIEVQIMGQAYVLGCPEGGEGHLRLAVERVDEAMGKIRDSGKVKARDRVAVLAALNIAFELVQAQEAPQNPAPLQASPANAAAEPASAAAAEPTISQPAGVDLTAQNPAAADWHKDLIAKLDDALSQDGRLL